MIEQNIGELAALVTVFSWTIVGIFFAKASSKIGSLSVNFTKLVLTFAFLNITDLIIRGYLFLQIPQFSIGHGSLYRE